MNDARINERIRSWEIDSAIRPGLDLLRSYFREESSRKDGKKNGSQAEQQKVRDFLKAMTISGQRLSAENNEKSLFLRFFQLEQNAQKQCLPAFKELSSPALLGAGTARKAITAAKSKTSKKNGHKKSSSRS